jgi:hypothetical protein
MPDKRRRDEAGIALVLALLSLMLLTFLGLGLAATTSTELQIANNYRWSQQAFYNAEAGLEIAKKVLEEADWDVVVPAARTDGGGDPLTWWGFSGTGGDDTLTPYETPAAGSRDYESWGCDWRGHGMGYGPVLVDGAGFPYAGVSSGSALYGRNLRGAFTIWVRRPVMMQRVDPDNPSSDYTGKYQDSTGENSIVITVEGVAPYSGAHAGTLLAQQSQAVRMIEATAEDQAEIEYVCEFQGGQTGGSEGSGFAKCYRVEASSIRAALGMSGSGDLAQSDVR